MVKSMRNHEAAHTVVAIHLGVPFNNIFLEHVTFPPEAATYPGFKTVIAAGCLGQFYEIWKNCLKGNEMSRLRGKQEKECLTPIVMAQSKFSLENYPDDFRAFTDGQTFDPVEYHRRLEEAWAIVEARWYDIERLSHLLGGKSILSYEGVVKLFNS